MSFESPTSQDDSIFSTLDQIIEEHRPPQDPISPDSVQDAHYQMDSPDILPRPMTVPDIDLIEKLKMLNERLDRVSEEYEREVAKPAILLSQRKERNAKLQNNRSKRKLLLDLIDFVTDGSITE